jgi:hypothetical protein
VCVPAGCSYGKIGNDARARVYALCRWGDVSRTCVKLAIVGYFIYLFRWSLLLGFGLMKDHF